MGAREIHALGLLFCIPELVDKNHLIPVFLEADLHTVQDSSIVCSQSNSTVDEKHEMLSQLEARRALYNAAITD